MKKTCDNCMGCEDGLVGNTCKAWKLARGFKKPKPNKRYGSKLKPITGRLAP